MKSEFSVGTPVRPAAAEAARYPHHRRIGRIAILLSAIVLLILYSPAREHLRAMSLLSRMSGQHNWISGFDQKSYAVLPITFSGADGPIRAKLYVPQGVQNPPAVVAVPGLHQLGIEEPRLINFAKSMAATGVEVLTPQIDALADYRVVPQSIGTIGRSAQELAHRSGKQVGVLGLSFAGGLSLMAAANPQYRNQISFVAAVGAQDDVERVEHYLVEGRTRWPDGRSLTTPPHEYGWLILIYSHPEDFFAPADIEIARTSLRLILHENLEAAKREAGRLSSRGQELMNAIFTHQRDGFRKKLLTALDTHSAEAAAVSPKGHMSELKANVLLMHGEGDDVIPPSETEWLALEIPKRDLQAVLISRAISHVSLEHGPGLRDQFALVHWIALLLSDADREQVSAMQ